MNTRSRKKSRQKQRSHTRQKRKDPKEKEHITTLVRTINTHYDEYGDGSSLFNLLLVKCGARKAYFFDNTNDVERTKKIIQLAKTIGLYVNKDPTTSEENPGYWIYQTMNKLPTSSEETGKILGFLNPSSDDSDFGNFRIHRASLHILEKTTNSYITSEVVMDDIETVREFAKQKVALFNQAMIEQQLPYRFKYEINIDDGTIQRMSELEQGHKEYLIKHRKEYINDFENIFDTSVHPLITLFKKMIHDKKLLIQYTPLFLYIYKMYNKWVILNDKQLDKIYTKFIDIYT